IVGTIEFLVKPRLQFFHQDTLFQRLAGVLITLSGVLLLLPLPIPFSNFFPALTVVLLASGALKQDGLCFLAGCLAFCLSAGYFTLLAFGGVKAVERLIRA
ncbi:MAG TPA: exopolysaccharide biosynthesis protein, partial [Candidatus Sulfotelmatobacter sp.]|nr:exopolysaccharide biosynthesis protein [Candidatus Sulfotelmatobacter sp.]